VKWTGLYFVGYLILIGGLLAALWKVGVIDQVGTGWTAIGVAIAIGIGIMAAVAAGSGEKRTIEIDRT
jgi:hypothetical protein